MDLRRLQYFLTVIEHGQITSAAAELHIAQPSLSQAIRTLEEDLGVELFVRDGRGLVPSAAGVAFVEQARRVLATVAAARDAVAGVRDLDAGWLDLAVPDLLARDPLPAVLAEFHRRHRQVPVRVHSPRDEDELVRRLMAGECELAVSFLPLPSPGLTVHPLAEHEIWVVLPPGAPVGGDRVALAELDGWAVIDATRGFSPSRVVRDAVRASSIRLRPVVRNRHREAVLPMVLAGAGMAFTVRGYADDAARGGAVVRRLDPAITCAFGAVHRTGDLSPAARGFIAVLDDIVTAYRGQ